MTLRERVRGLVARARETRAARAWTRFGERGGNLLSGGIAYSAVFSVFALLALGVSIGLTVLSRSPELQDQFFDVLASWLPGVLGPGGIVDVADLEITFPSTWVSAVSLAVLVWGAVGLMGAIGTGLQQMFGADARPGSAVMGLLRQAGALLALAVVVLGGTVLLVLTSRASGAVLGWFGATEESTVGQVAVTVGGVLVTFLVAAGLFAVLVRLLVFVSIAWRDLLQGSALAAVGLAALQVLGVQVVAASAGLNAVLAPFAVLVTLLVWLNLVARILLLAAAWTAEAPGEGLP